MATVAALPIELQFRQSLATELRGIAAVRSAHVYYSDRSITVWIDIADDEDTVRNSLYLVEDLLSEYYSGYSISFHLIPVPAGRKIEEFVTAECVYARRA